MKKLHSKKITNRILTCFIAIIMLCNFVMPKNSLAVVDTDEGGPLFQSLVEFTVYLGDKMMQWLQNSFISADEIEQEDGTYVFKYTPAIIFSGTVPALDINFIDPMDETKPRGRNNSRRCKSKYN